MARKERNNVDYFPHPVTHGKKMFYLRSKYGNDGYAIWFMLLEELGKADYHYLDLSDKIQLMYLSSEFQVSEIVLKEVINLLVEFGEFDAELWENSILFNQKFVDNISDAYKKRSNSVICKNSLWTLLQAKGSSLPDKSIPKHDKCILKVSDNTQSKVKDSKEKESRVYTPTLGIEVVEQYSDLTEEFKSMYSEDFYKSWLNINRYLDENCEYLRTWDNQIKIKEYKQLFDKVYKGELTLQTIKDALEDLNGSRVAKERYNSVYHGLNVFIKTIKSKK